MSAHPLTNPPRRSHLRSSVQPFEHVPKVTSEYSVSFRGLLVAAALATPFWIALYLLLR